MRRRFASFCAALLFITCSIISGPTYASDIWTVEDGDIDPWADLQELEQSPAPVLAVPDIVVASAVDGVVGGVQPFAADPVVPGEGQSFPVTYNGIGTCKYYPNTSVLYTDWTFSGQSFSCTGQVFNKIFRNYSGRSQIYGLVLDIKDSKLQIDLAQLLPEYDFSEVNGDLSLTFSFCACLRWLASTSLTAYQYTYPTRVVLYTGGSQYECDIDVSGEAEASKVIASCSIPSGAVSGITDLALDVYFPDVSYSTPVTYGTYYSGANMYVGFFSISDTVKVDTGAQLSGILGLLGTIVNGIAGLGSGLGDLLQAVLNLPANIANFILDGLSGLFVPSEEQLNELFEKYDGLFESKLGFVYQMFSFVADTFSGLKDVLAAVDSYSFTFPGISFPYNGEMIVILPETSISLDNAVMDVLRPVLGTIVCIGATLSFFSTGFDFVVAIMSGASYLEFLSQNREE